MLRPQRRRIHDDVNECHFFWASVVKKRFNDIVRELGEVLFNDFVDIRFVYTSVPGFLRINHHDRLQLTAVKTASLVNTDLALA